MRRLVSLLCLLLLSACGGGAVVAPLTQPAVDSLQNACLSQAQTRAEILSCHQRAYRQADQTLNQVYRAVRKRLDKPARTQLLNAQRAWLTYRDNNCAAESHLSNRSERSEALYQRCLTRMTEVRTAELRAAYLPGSLYLPGVSNISEQTLLGAWRGHQEPDRQLHFDILDGLHRFRLYHGSRLLENGQWQLADGKLTLTDGDGGLLHYYQKIELRGQQLTLHGHNGEVRHYQR